MVAMIIWRLWHWAYGLAYGPYPELRVSLLTTHTLRHWDGYLLYIDADGNKARINFLVDHQRFLFMPSVFVAAVVMQQLMQMGYDCKSIHIKHPNDRERSFTYLNVAKYIKPKRLLDVRVRYAALREPIGPR